MVIQAESVSPDHVSVESRSVSGWMSRHGSSDTTNKQQHCFTQWDLDKRWLLTGSLSIGQVPSSAFMCVGFRVRTGFSVSGTTESVFSVYEPQDKGERQTL